ncbi:hypothetical protein [Bacillus massilinigeriensis]|uniref:hypothetical protein n=1 Tax=Bacillus mediterraneensis TaxID=1805474 RepID=UPI0008F8728D|nr:hypothetical protein [Bacillus mediterraneensis]
MVMAALSFTDVSNKKVARKAAESGVDGLILVASGSGWHDGKINGFAFVDMVSEFPSSQMNTRMLP